MSVLLIALANTKGDVQDGFIQKVKFISSHGMFVLWIGYGLVFGAKFAVMLWRLCFEKTSPISSWWNKVFAEAAADRRSLGEGWSGRPVLRT
jgi:hypothetical protein